MEKIKPKLAAILSNLPQEPGIYRMLDEKGRILYVGKARSLKKRVSSYFKTSNDSVKTRSLVEQIDSIEVTVTRTETEALLLESNLIKSLRPKYNVLMRDDKSYPYLFLNNKQGFPSLEIVRLKKKPDKGRYFGPYPSASAVREALNLIQKIFKIRDCRDVYFKARSRPCLQYEIKRCSAPCVGYIKEEAYQQALDNALAFLQGKSQLILDELAQRMQEAAQRFAYEEAAVLRDQIKQLRLVQEKQAVIQLKGDADVLVMELRADFAALHCLSLRFGQVLSSQSYFPELPKIPWDEVDELRQQVFASFIAYYYLDKPERIPALIIIDKSMDGMEDALLIEALLSELKGKACRIQVAIRGRKRQWLDFALNNLRLDLAKKETSSLIINERYAALADFLKSDLPIRRMECFDISHTQGSQTVASCVVFDERGANKSAYRHFNIKGVKAGDDYAAMEQALRRRFQGSLAGNVLPDLLIIDGGKGQVAVAKAVLQDLGLTQICLLGIAKGPIRKAGLERLILATETTERVLAPDNKALHLLQQIRDEAHRFAIMRHRKKRQKEVFASSLETLAGIGAKRKQSLLQRFGGLQELAMAPMDELLKVEGISESLAQRIFKLFHE